MKLVKVTVQAVKRWLPQARARKCPICQRQIKAGQHVVQHRFAVTEFGDPELNIHVPCILALVENCPPDDIDPTDAKAYVAAVRAEAIAEAAQRELQPA